MRETEVSVVASCCKRFEKTETAPGYSDFLKDFFSVQAKPVVKNLKTRFSEVQLLTEFSQPLGETGFNPRDLLEDFCCQF